MPPKGPEITGALGFHLWALYPHQTPGRWWQRRDFRDTMIGVCFCSMYCRNASSCQVAPRPCSSCESPGHLQAESRVGEARLLLLPGRECPECVYALENPGKTSGTRTGLDCTVQRASTGSPGLQCVCVCVCVDLRSDGASRVRVSSRKELRQWTWQKALRTSHNNLRVCLMTQTGKNWL